MNILSLTLSTLFLSNTLRTSSTYEERKVLGQLPHIEKLLGAIKSHLIKRRHSTKDFKLLICTSGPGSLPA